MATSTFSEAQPLPCNTDIVENMAKEEKTKNSKKSKFIHCAANGHIFSQTKNL